LVVFKLKLYVLKAKVSPEFPSLFFCQNKLPKLESILENIYVLPKLHILSMNFLTGKERQQEFAHPPSIWHGRCVWPVCGDAPLAPVPGFRHRHPYCGCASGPKQHWDLGAGVGGLSPLYPTQTRVSGLVWWAPVRNNPVIRSIFAEEGHCLFISWSWAP